MSFHLDSATVDQLITIDGVGDVSATKIRQYLDNHGSFTQWHTFLGCANRVKFETLQRMHADGLIRSNIVEFQDQNPDQKIPNVEGAAKIEGAKVEGDNKNPEAAEIDTADDKGEEDKIVKLFAKLSGDLSKRMIEMEVRLTSKINDEFNVRINEWSTKIDHQMQGLSDREKDLSARVDALDRLVRTDQATNAHYSARGAPGGQSKYPPSLPESVSTPDSVKNTKLNQLTTVTPATRDTKKQVNQAPLEKMQTTNNSLAPTRVKIDAFEGKVGEWDNWFHKFSYLADTCGWNNNERLFKLTSALTSNALTVHRNLSRDVVLDFDRLCEALKERYGKMDSATQCALRANLQTIKQGNDEELGAFADKVYSMTLDAYPVGTPVAQLQQFAVDHFINGCKDTHSAWLAASVKNPATISEAVAQMKISQATCKRLGVKYATKKVSFDEDSPVVRKLEERSASVSECTECGGRGHSARDCGNLRSQKQDSRGCRNCGDSRCYGNCSGRRSPSPRTWDRPQGASSPNRRCWECGDFGHVARDCTYVRRPYSPMRRSDYDRGEDYHRGMDRRNDRRPASPRRFDDWRSEQRESPRSYEDWRGRRSESPRRYEDWRNRRNDSPRRYGYQQGGRESNEVRRTYKDEESRATRSASPRQNDGTVSGTRENDQKTYRKDEPKQASLN